MYIFFRCQSTRSPRVFRSFSLFFVLCMLFVQSVILHNFDDCYSIVGSCNKSKARSIVKLANHRKRWRRRPCGETLLKEVTLKDNTTWLYPNKIYCSQSVIESKKRLVKRRNCVNHCELWRSREVRFVCQRAMITMVTIWLRYVYGKILRITKVNRS